MSAKDRSKIKQTVETAAAIEKRLLTAARKAVQEIRPTWQVPHPERAVKLPHPDYSKTDEVRVQGKSGWWNVTEVVVNTETKAVYVVLLDHLVTRQRKDDKGKSIPGTAELVRENGDTAYAQLADVNPDVWRAPSYDPEAAAKPERPATPAKTEPTPDDPRAEYQTDPERLCRVCSAPLRKKKGRGRWPVECRDGIHQNPAPEGR